MTIMVSGENWHQLHPFYKYNNNFFLTLMRVKKNELGRMNLEESRNNF